MADVRIYTSRTCGWAVRNYAALIEKGVEFEAVPAKDGDGKKLGEFLALTPYGKTPVLRCGETAVFESWLINEYIDDRFPDPPLMPHDAAGRSEARKWTHYCENRLLPALTTIASAQDPAARVTAVADFGEHLKWFDKNVLRDRWSGPYFFGEQFSLVDLVYFTLFRTANDMERMLNMPLPVSDSLLQSWAENVLARPSLMRAMEIQEELEF